MKNKTKKNLRRIITLLVTVSMLVTMINGLVLAGPWNGATTTTPSQDGEGFYLIGTGEELAGFAKLVNNNSGTTFNAKLTNDIDLGSYNEWNPIGTSSAPYTGEFNGMGHKISGLFFSGQKTLTGLFGYTQGAAIKSVGLENTKISVLTNGTGYYGTLVGSGKDTAITNCYNIGTMYISFNSNNSGLHFVSGLVASVIGNSTLENCYTSTLIGQTYNGNRYNHRQAGNLVGNKSVNANTFTNCYYQSVEGNTYNSQPMGAIGSSTTGDLTAGAEEITEEDLKSGAVAYKLNVTPNTTIWTQDFSPYHEHPILINQDILETEKTSLCVYQLSFNGIFSGDKYAVQTFDLNSIDTTGYENVKFTDEMLNPISGEINVNSNTTITVAGDLVKSTLKFVSDGNVINTIESVPFNTDLSQYISKQQIPEKTNWDFKMWDNQVDKMPAQDYTINAVFGLKNQEIDQIPYNLIYDAEQLVLFRDRVNAGETTLNGLLMNDIDLSSICGESIGNWEPIGKQITGVTFNIDRVYRGTFNGNNFLIKNLYINNSEEDYLGLFGSIDDAKILNLGIENANITGNGPVSALTAFAMESNITNCNVSGTLTGYYVGGITGTNSNGGNGVNISNCFNYCEITGKNASYADDKIESFSYDYAGGISGWIVGNDTITQCFNSGNIKGSGIVGGIVGSLNPNNGDNQNITKCYNSGNITAAWKTGGIVGSNSGKVSNSYNKGCVISTVNGKYQGAIAGQNEGVISNTYYDNEQNLWGIGLEDGSANIDIDGETQGKNISKMWGTSPNELTNISNDIDAWSFRENDGVSYYTPQLKCFAESESEYIKGKSLNSVTVKTYSITYNGNENNGGQIPEDNNIYTKPEKVNVLFDKLPSKTDYLFLGWSLNPSAVTPEFTKDGVNQIQLIDSKNYVLYATWKAMDKVPAPIIDASPEETVENAGYDNAAEVTVSLTSAIENAKIYYSVDNGAVKQYTEPFKLSSKENLSNAYTIKAYATATDMIKSDETVKIIKFNEKMYSVAVDDKITNGTLNVSKNLAKKGESIVITPVPQDKYKIISVSVNGEKIDESNGNYTFVMPDKDVEVSAVFQEIKYSLTVENGLINDTNNTSGEFKPGETIIIKANPKDGKEFVNWEAEGTIISDTDKTLDKISIIMPEENVSIKGVVKDIPEETTKETTEETTIETTKDSTEETTIETTKDSTEETTEETTIETTKDSTEETTIETTEETMIETTKETTKSNITETSSENVTTAKITSKTETTSVKESVNTGDSNMYVVIIVGLIGLMSTAVFIISKKKKQI